MSARTPAHPVRSKRLRRAFTLTEMMAVVVILGILAALIFIVASWAIGDAQRAAFITDLRTMATAAELYKTKYGDYPGEADSGEAPEGLDEFVSSKKFARDTPIGGQWDFEPNVAGSAPGIGVDFSGAVEDDNEDVEQQNLFPHVQQIDDAIDDGNLNTGRFRKHDNNRFYYVLAN